MKKITLPGKVAALVLFLFLSVRIFPQTTPSYSLTKPTLRFEQLNTSNGLSNNFVFDLIQDRFGFLWFATDDGLNRFDGYEFKIFRNDPDDENSISGNSVWTIIEGSKGDIWIGTKNGWLNCYDPVKEKIKKWKLESDITEENAITVIFEDSKQNIWIGTYRSGLYKLNPTSGKITVWVHNPEASNSLSNNYISSIVEDHEGKIWVSTYSGLNQLDPELPSKGFTRFYNIPGNPNSLSSNILWFITRSKTDSGLIWIGTAEGLTSCYTDVRTFHQIEIPNPGNLQFGTSSSSVIEERINSKEILWIDSYAGLIRLNISDNTYSRFTSDKNNLKSLGSNQINGMIRDRSGVLWIATNNGLSYYSPKGTKFNNVLLEKTEILNPSALYNKNVKAIAETPGRIWFGTDEGLLCAASSGKKKIIKKISSTGELNIWSLTTDRNGSVWIGTYGRGIFRYDPDYEELTPFQNYDRRIKVPAVKYNKVVYCDQNNNIWIGYWGLGLAMYNPFTEEYRSWQNDISDSLSLSHNDVWSIYQDSRGRIWIGTNGGGLNLVWRDKEKDDWKFYKYTSDKNNEQSLSSNSIYSICEGESIVPENNETVLWIGTNEGLNELIVKYDINDRKLPDVEIKTFTIKDGLADNTINCIVEDASGNLWLGTSLGISMFNSETKKFMNFDRTDGISGGDFNYSAACKTENGLILMGSTSGLNYFYPDDISLSGFVPPVLITDFQIFNKSVQPGKNDMLISSVFTAESVKLSYTQNVFSLQFAALDYSAPLNIQYAYKMEGFDSDWILSGKRRFVTYTNLNPGEYTFKVKATNSDGIWNNNETSLNVIVTPPWWQTTWAVSLYILIFLLGLWGIIKFQSYRTHLQQELKIQEFEARHLREIENMKSRFFANLSHEFRTPLMLIKGPLEQMIKGKFKTNLQSYYRMLLRNTEKLQHLIDQLLELSQLEAETIPVNKQKCDLVNLLRTFVNPFIPLAEQKKINLSFKPSVNEAFTMVDRDKLEKIINNLLSNAFKFTPEGGEINVNLNRNEILGKSYIVIEVDDTGVGIPDEYRSRIFDRFYQVDDTSKKNQGGSGIGLALVKELVMLQKWDVNVKNGSNGGTKFTITIPVEESFRGEEQEDINAAFKRDVMDVSELVPGMEADPLSDKSEASEKNSPSAQKPSILIVEDSPDVRKYISDLLNPEYKVIQCEDAESGIKSAGVNMPDLILTDVMMPGMDGLEFCNQIKSDWKTSHIPVIVLTAKASHKDKIDGLETRADDYLTKPFNFEELSVRIRNLIEQRRLLCEKFSKEINIGSSSFPGNPVDKEFMEKLTSLIEKNLNRKGFNTEILAEEMFISRRQLHRKLVGLTGLPPGEFIRTIKLKKAARLLIENNHSITQIAYDVGFESPAQFTRAFKKQFNCLPSEFSRKKV